MAKLTDREKQAHYRQKIAKEYKDRLDSLSLDNRRLCEENTMLHMENVKLIKDNEKLSKENEELRKYLNLPEEDIKILVEKTRLDKKMADTFSSFTRFMG